MEVVSLTDYPFTVYGYTESYHGGRLCRFVHYEARWATLEEAETDSRRYAAHSKNPVAVAIRVLAKDFGDAVITGADVLGLRNAETAEILEQVWTEKLSTERDLAEFSWLVARVVTRIEARS